MEQQQHKQGSEEWLNDRSGMITSSRFGDVMTKGKNGAEFGQTAITYAKEIVTEIITNKRKDGFKSNATDHGNESEPIAVEAYEMETFQVVEETGFIKLEDMIGGSPDGLVGLDGTIEIKCPFNPTVHLTNLMNKNIGKSYYWQVRGHLLVTGRKWCDTISYHKDFGDRSLAIWRVHRDEKEMIQLRTRLYKFRELIIKMIHEVTNDEN